MAKSLCDGGIRQLVDINAATRRRIELRRASGEATRIITLARRGTLLWRHAAWRRGARALGATRARTRRKYQRAARENVAAESAIASGFAKLAASETSSRRQRHHIAYEVTRKQWQM